MKKILALFLVLVFIVGVVGCGGESPEQAVKNTFNAIKNSDSDTAAKYINYDELLKAGETSEEGTESDAESKEMAELIFKHFNYKIISSSEDGNSATVKAEITNIDMKTVFAKFVSEAFALVFSGLDQETMDKQMNDKFIELINNKDNKTVTKTVNVKLTKSEDSWKIDMSDDLMDAIFGGMISAAQNMNNSFNGNSDSNKLSEIKNWLIDDIWNKGFCDINWYTSSGTSSTGETLDIDFTLFQLDTAMSKKAEYDAYINGLSSDQYSQVKNVWAKLSSEINVLYAQIKNNKPVANDLSTDIDTGKFKQYEEAFSDAVYALDK